MKKVRSKIKEIFRPFVREALSDYLKDTEQDIRALQKAHPQLDLKSDLPSETSDVPVKEEKVVEASTTNAVAGYQTPYAFSDTGIGRDVKKRKIAQQLGYKLVKKNRLKEEVSVKLTKAALLSESFSPTLQSPEAQQLYDKMSYYMMIADDPSYKTIHAFRNKIAKIRNMNDQKQLIQYFNDEFRISPHQAAWDYYKSAE